MRRQNFHRQFSLALAYATSTITFAAAVANTQTGMALKESSNGLIMPGQASLALHWISCVTSLSFSIILFVAHRGRNMAKDNSTTTAKGNSTTTAKGISTTAAKGNSKAKANPGDIENPSSHSVSNDLIL
jgi:hypothetical protein